jgi:hypothetical protein
LNTLQNNQLFKIYEYSHKATLQHSIHFGGLV